MYVEYVNKNAFVEKVMNFLIYKLGDTVAIRVPGAILPHCVIKKDVIEDFVSSINSLEIERIALDPDLKQHRKENSMTDEDFEMALAEMIDKAQKSVIEPWVVAAQWKDKLVKLAKSKEPVSEDLNEAKERIASEYMEEMKKKCGHKDYSYWNGLEKGIELGAQWQKNNLWKPADGNDLPEIDREVIALLNSGKVVFAHRPYKGKCLGKNLTTGNIETFENETYDKGEWNIPDVMYWLDCEMPKEMKDDL